jgi:4-amino-4-deoxychorismate lyase
VQSTWLVNGLPGPLDPSDRGLAYGDGLFETMAAHSGEIRWLERHLQRLREGCRRLSIPVPDCAEIRRALSGHVPRQGKAVVKLIVTRGIGQRGYRPPPVSAPTWILGIGAWPPYPAANYTRGVTVTTCNLRLGRNPVLAGLKHLNRLEQVLAQLELRDARCDEGLLLDTSGFVVGGTMSNVFAVRGPRLLTPRLSFCGVRGVMRQVVMDFAPRLGLQAEEAEVGTGELREADELFLTNALFGIWPIRELDGRALRCGAVARQLIETIGFPRDS